MIKKNPMWKKLYLFAYAIGVILIVLTLVLVGHRENAAREVDDVHFLIPCSQWKIDDSEWLWVIPLYNNQPIANNSAYCKELLATGKKLGMHGVKHTYNEFNEDVTKEYIQAGMEAFKDAFGYYPTDFKPPKMNITENNVKLVKELNMTLHTRFQQIIHKVHHCEDYRSENQGRLQYE